MKSNYVLSALIFLIFIVSTAAQEQPPKSVRNVAVQNIDFQAGSLVQGSNFGSLADFQKLAPGSALLKNDLSGFSQKDVGKSAENGMFAVSIGLHFGNKKESAYRQNPLLRLGLNYYRGTQIKGHFEFEDRKPYDTLVSFQTGQVFYVDSVFTEYYRMKYSSEKLRLDVALIFRTRPEARVSMFTGFGVNSGVSLMAWTEITKEIDARTETDNSFVATSSSGTYIMANSFKSEKFTNQSDFDLFAYVPIGVDMRFGRKNNFWRSLHLLFELRPGINYYSIPELGDNARGCIQIGLGIRSSIDKG